LNLLRVFTVVAESGGVTAAAAQLYLTQPAISAALRRLTAAVGAPLFIRQGRGLALTSRGSRLLQETRVHLHALVDAALAPAQFDARRSDRTVRLGLSDTVEIWLLPSLLRILARQAPNLRVIALPVQFRNVGAALASGSIDAAITVADELPDWVRRESLFWGGFVCLFDPRHAKVGRRLTEASYFAQDHVVVSYNGDLRGIVEDLLNKTRKVRCSISGFANLGALVDGSALLATVPQLVAHQIRAVRPHLRCVALPFALPASALELLWPAAADDDPAGRFVRDQIIQIARALPGGAKSRPR
jgi:LysR family transcriptional activator of mexEF-oprN operon